MSNMDWLNEMAEPVNTQAPAASDDTSWLSEMAVPAATPTVQPVQDTPDTSWLKEMAEPAVPAQPQTRPTEDNLAQNRELIDAVRRSGMKFDADSVNKDYNGFKTDEDVARYYVDQRRWKDANLFSLANEVKRAFLDMNPQDKKDLALQRQVWEQMPTALEKAKAGDWTGAADIVWENFTKGLVDPTNLVTLGLGSLVKNTAGRVAITTGTDALLSGLADVATQNVEQQVGMRDSIDLGRAGTAAVVGGAVSAGGTALIEGGRKLIDMAFNGKISPTGPVAKSLENAAPDEVQAVAKVQERMPVIADIPEREPTYKVFDTNGQVAYEGADLKLAQQQAKANGTKVEEFMGEQPQGEKGFAGWWRERVMNNMLDSTVSFENLSEKAKPFTQGTDLGVVDAYTMTLFAQNKARVAEAATAAHGGGQVIFKEGQGFEYIEGSRGLREIMGEMSKIDSTLPTLWGQYAMAKRVLQMEAGTGREAPIASGMGDMLPDLEKFVAFMEREHRDVLDKYNPVLQQFNDNYLAFQRSTGRISDEQVQRYKDSSMFYMTINRILDIDTYRGRSKGDTLTKAMKGVDPANNQGALFADPLRSYMDNIEAGTIRGYENLQKLKTVQTIQSMPGPMQKLFGEEVSPDIIAKRISFENLQSALDKQLKEAGATPMERDIIDVTLRDVKARGNGGVMDFLTFFGNDSLYNKLLGEKNVFVYHDNGVLKAFRVTRPDLAASMAQFTGMKDAFKGTAVGNAIRDMVQFFQYTITRDPEFVLGTSLMTDTWTAWAHSDRKDASAFLPLVDIFTTFKKGVGAQFDRKTNMEALAMGVTHGGVASVNDFPALSKWLRSKGIEPDYRAGISLDQASHPAHAVLPKALGAVGTVKDRVFDAPAHFIESAPRLGEYAKLREEPGITPAEAAQRAIQNNVDFRRKGANDNVVAYMQLVPFLRAVTNVYNRYGRSFNLAKEGNLIRQSKVMLGITLPATAYALWAADDPRMQAIPDDERKMYWHIFVPGRENPIKIRKPEDITMVSTFLEKAAVEMARTDHDGLRKAREMLSFGGQLASLGFRGADSADTLTNVLPMGVKTAVNLSLNNAHGASPIVPTELENVDDPRMQYVEGRTSPLARDLANTLAKIPGMPDVFKSPMKLEFMLRDLGGSLGKYAIEESKRNDPKFKDFNGQKWTDNYVVRRFINDANEPSKYTAYNQEFTDLLKEANQANGRFSLIKKYGRTDELPAAQQAAEDPKVQALLGLRQFLNKTQEQISEARKAQKQIFNSTMPAEQKQKQNDALQKGINAMVMIATIQSNKVIMDNQIRAAQRK